ncbi:Uncharacterized protein TCM_001421 [Theobroma cacao]|uniref:Uncharacterized protein n=1 Tax=Theobroma cacao TaxID=3641 RepID=A0A061DKA1_THECC|nr:Uncharacterized protein TCM_001421 [Theobroma cacao]
MVAFDILLTRATEPKGVIWLALVFASCPVFFSSRLFAYVYSSGFRKCGSCYLARFLGLAWIGGMAICFLTSFAMFLVFGPASRVGFSQWHGD